MLGERTSEQWIAQYASSHQHPVNRICHTLGIPTIVISLALFIFSLFFHRLWILAALLFLIGWALQFLGHKFEGMKPAFFDDVKQLLVGPLFVCAEIAFAFGARGELRSRIEAHVGPTVARRAPWPA